MAAKSYLSQDNRALIGGSDALFEFVCEPCECNGEIKEAVGYCIDCWEHLCAACVIYHKRFRTFRNHTIVENVDIPNSEGASPIDVCTERCGLHNDIIKYYCTTHRSLCCGDCIIRDHNTCKGKVCISDIAKDLTESDELNVYQTTMDSLISKSDNLIKSSKSDMNYTADYRIKALHDMETFHQEIKDALNMLKTALEEEIEDIATNVKKVISSVVEKSTKIKIELGIMSSDFAALLEKKRYCQMFTEMKTSESKLEKFQQQLDEMENSYFTAYMFEPSKELQELVKSKKAPGKLLVRNAEQISATHLGEINVKSSDDEEIGCISGAILLSMDKLVVADWGNDKVKLIHTKHEQTISEYVPGDAPFDVTTVNTTQVAVTIPYAQKVALLNLNTEDTLVYDRDISVNKPCWSLARADDKLVVSFEDPYEVKLLSMAGEELQTFPTFSQGEPLINDAPRVTVSANKHAIYASDHLTNRVIMFDMDGNVLSERQDDDIQNLSNIAVDDADMVYVCDAGANTIQLWTPHFSKVKVLLTERDGVKWPRVACYCSDTGKLYVGMGNNDNINVYQLT